MSLPGEDNPSRVSTQDELRLEKAKFRFERFKYRNEKAERELTLARLAAERDKLDAERLKADADRAELRATGRRAYLQIVLSALAPLALIVAAFITFEKDALLRTNKDLQIQKDSLESQSRQLTDKNATLTQQQTALEDRRKTLESANQTAEHALKDLQDQLDAAQRAARTNALNVRISAYVDQLLAEDELTVGSSIYNAIVKNTKEDKSGAWAAEIEHEADDPTRGFGARALLLFALFQATDNRVWLERSEDLCMLYPKQVSKVSIGIFSDGSVADRDREHYLRKVYDTLPPYPDSEGESYAWAGTVSSIFQRLYQPPVAEQFRQPIIDQLRFLRDWSYKRDYVASPRQHVLQSTVCHFCVGGQARALANLCCSQAPVTMPEIRNFFYSDHVGPKPQFGYLPNFASERFEKQRIEFNKIVEKGDAAALEEFRARWKKDPVNAEMTALWVEDDSIDFLQHVRKEIFEKMVQDIWIFPNETD
jgi:hypothetical protein